MSAKDIFRSVWFFIWESNSIWSWIVNIILAFLIIKYLLYPGLGLLFGTSYPIVAVVSGSMEHNTGFDEWWSRSCADNKRSQADIYVSYGISKEQFETFSFRNGFNAGDLMIIRKASVPQVGDVVVFSADNLPEPIIHRVVRVGDGLLKSKGDNNCGSSSFEENVPNEKLIGKAFLKIPYLGWVKIVFVKIVRFVMGLWG